MKAVKTKQVAKPYEPTAQEREGIEVCRARRKERKPAPRMKVTEKKGGVSQVSPDHPDLAVGHILLMCISGLRSARSEWRSICSAAMM